MPVGAVDCEMVTTTAGETAAQVCVVDDHSSVSVLLFYITPINRVIAYK